MPFIRQQVGGTSAQINNYKGYDKQLVVNTQDHRLHVMDGDTHGGFGVVMQYDLPLGSDDIADKSITSAKLADGAITSDKIPSKAITTAKLADGAVTTPKLADDAVTSEKIKDGEVKTADLADESVTTPKLANGAVTSEKIKDGEVKTVDLADGAVTYPKLNSALVATPDEAAAGTATNKLVTPAGLARALASASSKVSLTDVNVTWAANATSCTISNSAIKANSLLLVNPPSTKGTLESLANAEMYLKSQVAGKAVLGALGNAPSADATFTVTVLSVN